MSRLFSLAALLAAPCSVPVFAQEPFGVAMLNADASTMAWSAAPGAVARCAVGSDGTTAALVDNAVSVYSAAGALQ
jgi:hypothetical protein